MNTLALVPLGTHKSLLTASLYLISQNKNKHSLDWHQFVQITQGIKKPYLNKFDVFFQSEIKLRTCAILHLQIGSDFENKMFC